MSKSRTNCEVDGCKNKKNNQKLSFFHLPKDKESRNKWLTVIGRPDLMNRNNLKPKSHVVCSIHFERNMILQTPRLHPDAIPTKYLPSPSSSPTIKSELESSTIDASTQTFFSEVNIIPIHKIKTETIETLSVPTKEINVQNQTQTSVSLSQDTPRKRKLNNNLKESEQKRRRLEREIQKIEKEVQAKNTFCLDRCGSDDNEVTEKFHKLIEWQSKLKKKRRGNRYDLEFKLFALNLHFSSPQTYRSLKTFLKLPSETTLERFKLNIPPKFEDRTLDFLSSKLKSLPDEAKYCTVCINEMALKRNLHYDTRRDNIVGLHNINGEVTNELASNACVIMLRGIMVNWKQPVAYSLLASSKHYEKIETWLDEVITKLTNIGIEVMGIVSVQGSNFDKFAKEIKNITIEKPYFELNGRKIYYIIDVPHLIKCLRNNLLTNDFYHDDKKISWKFIRQLYSNQKIKDLRLMPKITEAHTNPNNFQKMQVKYATQVFSLSVVAALKTLIYTKDIPKEAEATAEFLEKINNWFDVLNSSKVKANNKFQTAFAFRKHQIDTLQDILGIFKNITALSTNNTRKKSSEPANTTNRIKTFKNIQISIQAILMLCRDLKDTGFNFVFTRRLNQGPLENFFGAIRQQGGNGQNPTSIQFVRAFSKLFLSNMLKKSPHSNCQEDLCDLLQKGNEILSQPIYLRDRPNAQLSELALEGECDYRFDVPTENAITYLAGYLLFKCCKKHCCTDLTTEMKKIKNLDKNKMFSDFRAINKSSSLYGGLKVPPESFITYIKELEAIFLNNFHKTLTSRPGSKLYNILKEVNCTHLCTCFPAEYLLKLFVRFRVFATIRFNNRNLREGKKVIEHYIKVRHL